MNGTVGQSGSLLLGIGSFALGLRVSSSHASFQLQLSGALFVGFLRLEVSVAWVGQSGRHEEAEDQEQTEQLELEFSWKRIKYRKRIGIYLEEQINYSRV